MLIVGLLEDGPRRFGEIRDTIGISPKVLTEPLRTLERDGLWPEPPTWTSHRESSTRDALGLTLCEPLAAIRNWGGASRS